MRVFLLDELNYTVKGRSTFPLGLMYLQAYLKDHGQKDVFLRQFSGNEKSQIRRMVSEIDPDIVGLSCNSWNRNKILSVAKTVKSIKKDVIIILGGFHASLMRMQMIQHCSCIDYIVNGEGELAFNELVCRLAKGGDTKGIPGITFRDRHATLVDNPPGPCIANIDMLPFPCYDDVKENISHGAVLRICASRGCPFQCAYCSVSKFYNHQFRRRSNQNVIEEMKYLKEMFGARSMLFSDDFMPPDQQTRELFRSISEQKLNLELSVTMRINDGDDETLRIMRKAGVVTVTFGLESASARILKSQNREPLLLPKAVKTFKKSRELNLETRLYAIFGWPAETWKDVHESALVISQLKPGRLFLFSLLLYPGTQIYEQAKVEGLISDDYWLLKRSPPQYQRLKNGWRGVLRIYIIYSYVLGCCMSGLGMAKMVCRAIITKIRVTYLANRIS